MIPAIPPVKNAIYKAKMVPEIPKVSPKTKENFTSPKPIPFPLVNKKIRRKKINEPTADNRCSGREVMS